MKPIVRPGLGCAVALCLAFTITTTLGQTDGTATFRVTLVDYTGNASSDDHYAVAWVAKADGTFVKSLWKQGPTFTSGQWNNHCAAWNTARGGSTVVDGWSGATARDYTASTNNPVSLTWNCRDLNNNLVPDGNYIFWVQYAEDAGSTVQGPTNTVAWVKGPAGVTNTTPNVAGRFLNMTNTWAPLVLAVTIASVQKSGNSLVLSGTGTPNATYRVLFATNATMLIGDWTPIKTNNFDAGGNYTYTTPPIGPADPTGYYRLRSP